MILRRNSFSPCECRGTIRTGQPKITWFRCCSEMTLSAASVARFRARYLVVCFAFLTVAFELVSGGRAAEPQGNNSRTVYSAVSAQLSNTLAALPATRELEVRLHALQSSNIMSLTEATNWVSIRKHFCLNVCSNLRAVEMSLSTLSFVTNAQNTIPYPGGVPYSGAPPEMIADPQQRREYIDYLHAVNAKTRLWSSYQRLRILKNGYEERAISKVVESYRKSPSDDESLREMVMQYNGYYFASAISNQFWGLRP